MKLEISVRHMVH